MTTKWASWVWFGSSPILFLSTNFEFGFQECESEGANKMVDYLRDLISKSKPGDEYGKFVHLFFLMSL